MLSAEELEYYQKQIIMSDIGLQGQAKIKAARVLVVGAGGLGCPALQYLTAAGTGTVGIIDFDLVQESNLHRQVLFSRQDLSKPKVNVAVEKLSQLNSLVNFEPYNKLLNASNALEIIGQYDVVLDCTDNYATRYLINDACLILGKPWIFGAVYKFIGQLSVFNYCEGPTYRCLIPESEAVNSFVNCSSVGVLGVIPGIIGNLQACECLKIILDLPGIFSGKLLQFDALKMNFEEIPVEVNAGARKINKLSTYPKLICEDESNIQSLSVTEFDRLLHGKENFVVFNISENKDVFDTGIPVVKCDIEQIFFDPDKIPNEKKVVIVCEMGIKSREAVRYLQFEKEKTNVYSLNGGYQQWKIFSCNKE